MCIRDRHVGGHFVFRSYPRHIFGEAGGEEQFPEGEYHDLRHNGYQTVSYTHLRVAAFLLFLNHM